MALPGAQPVETMETVRRLLKTERPNDFKVSLVVSIPLERQCTVNLNCTVCTD